MLIELRLSRESTFEKHSTAVIQEYLNEGYAKLVNNDELNGSPGRTWYLPHHGVVNPQKPDKLRVVFDASGKRKESSLNSILLKGPNLEDQSVLRFLWYSDANQTTPQVYQIGVQKFGAVSSPFIRTHVLQQHAEKNRQRFTVAADRVKDHLYVDNLFDSFFSEEEALVAVQEYRQLLEDAGFHLNQWVSSSRAVMDSIPSEDWSQPNLDLSTEEMPTERTLGGCLTPKRMYLHLKSARLRLQPLVTLNARF